HATFVVTSLLNVLSMFCLLKRTPPKQAPVRLYLVYIQVLVILSSVYLDPLFEPIPTFPAIAGYYVGPLCQAGIRPHTVLVSL
uniref:G protein-coupled receptor n=1 Tax=Pristionchus pacificus TaxID=54126 RepID=A0A2A6B353_PRIPA